ncbi:hypothetical protein [Facklamia sp. 7083-14-GEN3]|uniref:hypothetical protein n=1 Tax=Facklamia sp. 7083-14-GEN3 TaxID=2973478 RepID=UPI00215C8F7D|nr:hypothetical protein [Facklamia sp. 7083-14-GEN3]MCR8970012.1 hypothetical protein [Facklamia sp. 7083-14-GEN3]
MDDIKFQRNLSFLQATIESSEYLLRIRGKIQQIFQEFNEIYEYRRMTVEFNQNT